MLAAALAPGAQVAWMAAATAAILAERLARHPRRTTRVVAVLVATAAAVAIP
jgi:predicted metal-binding membrane protein